MWIDRAGQFQQGDELGVDCRVIWPEGFREATKPRVHFRLFHPTFHPTALSSDCRPDKLLNCIVMIFGIEGFLVLRDIFQAHFLAVSRRGFLQHPMGSGWSTMSVPLRERIS